MSITSANAIVTLSQPILFPTPVQLQNFSADEITDIDAAEIVERQMGVDGILSFGFIWVERFQRIMLKADSVSNAFFDTVNTQQEAVLDVYPLNGSIVLPGAAIKFDLLNGALATYKPMPPVRKSLQPREYRIVWNRVVPSPA